MTNSLVRTSAVALLAVLCAANMALAGSVSITQTPNGGGNDGQLNLAGSVTNDVVLTSAGTSIFSQQMRLVLSSGSVLDHAFGTTTPPNQALTAAFSSLSYDSFVSAGTYNNGNGAAPTPGVIGRSDELGGPGGTPATFSGQLWDVLWGPALGQDTADQADFLSARLTLSGDANGTFSYRAVFGDGIQLLTDLSVVNGVIMQEIIPPNTPPVGDALSLLGVSAGADLALAFTATDAEDLANELVYSEFSFVGAPGFGGTGVFNESPVFNADGSFTWNTLGSARGTYTATATVTDTGGLTGTASYEITITAVPEPATFGLVGLALVGVVGLIRRRS